MHAYTRPCPVHLLAEVVDVDVVMVTGRLGRQRPAVLCSPWLGARASKSESERRGGEQNVDVQSGTGGGRILTVANRRGRGRVNDTAKSVAHAWRSHAGTAQGQLDCGKAEGQGTARNRVNGSF